METLLEVVLQDKSQRMKDNDARLRTVAPDALFADAIRSMSEANVGCVLVIDDGSLVGILTERDVLHRIASHPGEFSSLPVRDFMNADLYAVPPDMTVEEALAQCTDRRIRHLPIVEEGRLLGLLSIGDLVFYVVKDKERTISDLTEYMFGQQIQV